MMTPLQAVHKILDLDVCYQVELNERGFLSPNNRQIDFGNEFSSEDEENTANNEQEKIISDFTNFTKIITKKETLMLYDLWYVTKNASKENIFFKDFNTPRTRTSVSVDPKKFEVVFKCTEIPIGDIVFLASFPLVHIKNIFLSKPKSSKDNNYIIVETNHGKSAIPF